MKKALLLGLVLLVVAFGLSAGGQRATDEITIGLSYDNLESQFWLANYNGLMAYVEQLGGIRIVEVIADGDAARQNEQIETLIARGVDAIIAAPVDGDAIVAGVRSANDAGVPFITNNRAASGGDVAFNMASDNTAMARRLAEAALEWAKDQGSRQNVLLFVGDLGDVNAVLRDQGFMEVIEANPEWLNLVAKVPTEWNPELAYGGAVNAFEAHDINIVMAPSDFLLPAIKSAMQQQDVWHQYDHPDHVFYATLDGAEDALDEIAAGYVDIVSVQDAISTAERCVDAAVTLAQGGTLPSRDVKDPGFEVTRDNFDEMAYQAWGYVDR